MITQQFITILAWIQGLYYLITGIWPFVSLSTFLKITGPKKDLWLVYTVGVLVIVIGTTLLIGSSEATHFFAIPFLGAGSALVLAAIEFYFVIKNEIAKTYLFDAFLEVVLVVSWALTFVIFFNQKP